MELVEVTARFDHEGQVFILSFNWRGHGYPVLATGRRWQDEEGQHILVMSTGNKVYELIFIASVMRWYLKQTANHLQIA